MITIIIIIQRVLPRSPMSTPHSSSRGRSNRTRNGGRGSRNTRDDNPLPKKPSSVVSTDKPKTSSGLSSRANSTQSSPVVESPASPASSRSSNRRRRSGAGRGNNIPKIKPPSPDVHLPRSDHSRIAPVPHTAPVKDRPPHLVRKQPRTPTTSVDMNKDIDALVERVRAAAMADHRPSTPGSHIDWAGDDDDSLPDLNDWGISTLPDPKAHAISPIIVDGLRPLPELSSGLTAAMPDKSSPLATVKEVSPASEATDNRDIQKPSIHSSLPPKPQATSEIHEPMTSRSAPSPSIDFKSTHHDNNESVHTSTIDEKSRPERGGLAASIYAPQNATESSAPPGSRYPRHPPPHHMRAQTVGRPFPRLNQNDPNSSRPRSPRLSHGGSPKHHTRNYSSPATANRHSHSRPVLTGDALSRLVKAVGSTTVPSAKSTPLS